VLAQVVNNSLLFCQNHTYETSQKTSVTLAY